MLRRSKKEKNKQLEIREITLDLDTYKAIVGNQEVELTYKEFEIMYLLMSNKNKVVLRKTLLDKVWGSDYEGDSRVLDNHIKNLRKKLNISYIKTLKGVGYKFEE